MDDMQLIVGTYTEPLPHIDDGKADGILGASFDTESGRIGPLVTLAVTRNPSYLAVSPSGRHVYAINETLTFEDREGGGVTAFARDPGTAALVPLNARPSLGVSPCHVSVDQTGGYLLVANYGVEAGSVTVYGIAADGSIGDLTEHVELAGSGPDPVRQTCSHAHMTATDQVTGDIVVTDLGSDMVLFYPLDPRGRLTPASACTLAAHPGAGPRHLAFHPDRQHMFVVNELDSTVCTLRRHGEEFEPTDVVCTLPSDAAPVNLAAAVRVSPSGRHVVVSNRGHDSLAVFAFDPGRSTLTIAGITPSAAAFPRDFVFAPDGRHVIVAGQNNDLLASFAFNDANGDLRLVHTTAAPTPVCVALV
jgi:6-phosphogluconolactonase